MINRWYKYLLLLLVLASANATAATVFVTSQLQFGLHADKSIGSPVIKLLPTGTPLELIKTEDTLSYVRTEDGTGGWIDNSYLTQDEPLTPTDSVASPQTPSDVQQQSPAETGDGSTLEQQLKTERVRAGELQVQVAELRKRLGQDGTTDSLYEKIDQLAVEKKQMEVRMAQILEERGAPAAALRPDNTGPDGLYNLRNMLIALAVSLVAGIIAGLYLMDFLYRRRHGGFRI
jgi:uncharacterized protein YgiM (DUF1202 family)